MSTVEPQLQELILRGQRAKELSKRIIAELHRTLESTRPYRVNAGRSDDPFDRRMAAHQSGT